MEGTVTLEIQEYNELYMKAVQGQMLEKEYSELREENEMLKARKVNLPDEVESYDTPYGRFVAINGKQIRLKNGNIRLCNEKR